MIAVEAVNATEGPAGLLAVLVVRTALGERRIVTDAAWKVTDHKPDGNWRAPVSTTPDGRPRGGGAVG